MVRIKTALFHVDRFLLGRRHYATNEERMRSRILVVYIGVSLVVSFFNWAVQGFAFREPLNIAAVVMLPLLIAALRARVKLPIIGLLFGFLMESVYIESIAFFGSYAALIGLGLIAPLLVLAIEAPAASALLVPEIAFIITIPYLDQIWPALADRISPFARDFPWSEAVTILFLWMLFFIGSWYLDRAVFRLIMTMRQDQAAIKRVMEAGRIHEKELADSIAILELVMDAFPVPAFVKNEAFEYRFCSRSYCDFLGLTAQAIIGQNNPAFLPAELAQLATETDDKLKSGNNLQYYIYRLQRENGPDRDIVIQKTALRRKDGSFLGIVGVVQDETERIARERGLQALLEANRRALSLLGHDLKNPIGSFRALLRSMMDDEIHDPNDWKRVLKEMGKSFDALWNLLNELLEWVRDEGGMTKLDRKRFMIGPLMKRIVAISELQAGEKDIQVELAVADGLAVDADERMLSAILRNLVSNAIKFTPRGGKVRIEAIRSMAGAAGLLLTVADTGIGLPANATADEPFAFPQRFGTDDEIGIGLGLPFITRLAEWHGGSLKAANREGGGSRFMVFFPDT